MGRHKKIKNELPLAETIINEVSTMVENSKPCNPQVSILPTFKRNNNGLYDHIVYTFKSNGFIDWRKMVSSEHIVLNRENFLKKDNPVDIDSLLDDEIKNLKNDVEQNHATNI